MLYQFKGFNGKVELYENKIVIIRNAFSTFPRGTKEIYIKNLSGVQIKKPGLQSGYIQFIFSGSQEVKSKNIMNSAYDENTIIFQQNGYQNALVLKQKIEELINKTNENKSHLTNDQYTSQADELLKFKQLLDSGAITEVEFQTQKNKILGLLISEQNDNTDVSFNYTAPKYEYPAQPINNNFSKNNNSNKKDTKSKMKIIAICFAVLVLLIGIVGSMSEKKPTDNTTPNNESISINDNITINEVKEWYENQIPAVSQMFIEYAKSVDGISAINVSDSKFRFGENSGWYDCYYTIYFTCNINGEVHSGESRAFLKYNENDINFFHFEIFANDGIVSVVEHYDADYDKIIEDYYKELISCYK